MIYPGQLAGLIGGGEVAAAGPVTISGTETEGETLTASGGDGSNYTWTRTSDSEVLGTGSIIVIPAITVGDTITATSGGNTDVTGTIKSNALVWADATDYVAFSGIPSRSEYSYTLTESGASPTTGTDSEGAYVSFVGAGTLKAANANIVPEYTSGEYTVYCLVDNAASYASREFIGELYQSSNRLALCVASTGNAQVLTSGYNSFGVVPPSAMDLNVYTLSGKDSVGDRRGYHDSVLIQDDGHAEYAGVWQSALAGSTYVSIGGLDTAQTWSTKFRFLAIYDGLHDAAKRADVRAAIKRNFPNVDSAPQEWSDCIESWDAENVVVTGTDVDELTGTVNGNDLLDVGTNTAQLMSGFGSSGRPYVRFQPDGGGTGNEYRIDALDVGGTLNAFSVCYYGRVVAEENAARWIQYNGNSNYPQIRETPTQVIFYPEATNGGAHTTKRHAASFIGSWDGSAGTFDFLGNEGTGSPAATGHPNNQRFAIPTDNRTPNMEWCQTTIFSRELTETERLMARAYGWGHWHTDGRSPILDVDARDATVTSGEITEVIDRATGVVFTGGASLSGPFYEANVFGDDFPAMYWDATAVDFFGTLNDHPMGGRTWHMLLQTEKYDDDLRVIDMQSGRFIIQSAYDNDLCVGIYDGSFREADDHIGNPLRMPTSACLLSVVRGTNGIARIYVDGEFVGTCGVNVGEGEDADFGGDLGIGGGYASFATSRQYRGRIGKVACVSYAQSQEEISQYYEDLVADGFVQDYPMLSVYAEDASYDGSNIITSIPDRARQGDATWTPATAGPAYSAGYFADGGDAMYFDRGTVQDLTSNTAQRGGGTATLLAVMEPDPADGTDDHRVITAGSMILSSINDSTQPTPVVGGYYGSFIDSDIDTASTESILVFNHDIEDKVTYQGHTLLIQNSDTYHEDGTGWSSQAVGQNTTPVIGNALAGANSTRQVIGNIRLIDGFAGALTPNQLAAKMLEYQQAFALDWNPLMIQGLVAWIDPAYATLDGGVDFAPDRSLYGNHFEQTDAGTRLGLDATTAAFNNLPTFTSDGTGFLEEVRTGRLNRRGGTSYTTVTVAAVSSGTNGVLISNRVGSGAGYRFRTNATNVLIQVEESSGAGPSSVNAKTSTAPIYYRGEYNAEAHTAAVYEDGVLRGSVAEDLSMRGSFIYNGSYGWSILADPDGTTLDSGVDMGQTFIFDRILTDAEHVLLGEWLDNIYGFSKGST